MRLPREIIIRIHPDGKVEFETFGFVGKSCVELSEYLERLLVGEKPDSNDIQRDLKVDYYLTDVEQELNQEDRNY